MCSTKGKGLSKNYFSTTDRKNCNSPSCNKYVCMASVALKDLHILMYTRQLCLELGSIGLPPTSRNQSSQSVAVFFTARLHPHCATTLSLLTTCRTVPTYINTYTAPHSLIAVNP